MIRVRRDVPLALGSEHPALRFHGRAGESAAVISQVRIEIDGQRRQIASNVKVQTALCY
jgi:hypothetical protein